MGNSDCCTGGVHEMDERWISVKDRLPERKGMEDGEAEYVLVAFLKKAQMNILLLSAVMTIWLELVG